MPNWYFEKSKLLRSPSFLDGIDAERESRYRREGARLIIETGSKMDLGYYTVATGVVYFHRFYTLHSFRTFPRYPTACCCLFLAGKVEETPKKCRDIIRNAKLLLTDAKFATFGDNPKEEVMTIERILLQTIKFDLQVEHPYTYLLKYAKCLKGDKAKMQKMVQMAWTFVNDSLCTTLCLQWEPEVIAVALMFLAGKLSKFEMNDWNGRLAKHDNWWDMFVEDMTVELLEDICHQVLDLYSPQRAASREDSPPLPPPPSSKSAEDERTPAPPGPSRPEPPATSAFENGSDVRAEPVARRPKRTIEGLQFAYPTNFVPMPPAYRAPPYPPPIPPMTSLPPPMIPVPRPPVGFSEPPPGFPPPVNVPPPVGVPPPPFFAAPPPNGPYFPPPP